MIRSALCPAVYFALAILPAAAQAQENTASASLYPDLPMRADAPLLGPVPTVGPTPGFVLELVSPSQKCSSDANKAADGLMTPNDAVVTCNQAITSPATTGETLAATHVNRGVLLLSMIQPADAKRDFERALEIAPDLPEALVNRAIIKLAEGQVAEGVADLDRAIELNPERPERAYFHRGVGRELLNNVRGAYEDYRMAQALKPDWEEPAKELARFQVRARTP